MNNTYSILIIEDRAEIAERLSNVVSKDDRLEVVGVAGSLALGLELLTQSRPRVVLIDLGLPDGSGVQVIDAVTQADWDCDALVISVFGDEARVIDAIQAGAKGYVLKSAGFEDISGDIMTVIAGGSPISPSIAKHLLNMLKLKPSSTDGVKIELTTREIEILGAVAQGYKRREIGEQLDISTGTVGNHINSIYRKLNVGSNIQAVAQATKLGIL